MREMNRQEAKAILNKASKWPEGINPTPEEKDSFTFMLEAAEIQFNRSRYDLLKDTCLHIQQLRETIIRREADQLNLFSHSLTPAAAR